MRVLELAHASRRAARRRRSFNRVKSADEKKTSKTREDLEYLLNEFYKIATKDNEIGHHFDGLDLETHLPVIVDFWEKTLFGKPVYFGNPLFIHEILHAKSPLTLANFSALGGNFQRGG